MKTPPKISSSIAPSTEKAFSDLLKQLHLEKTPFIPCGLATRLNWGPPLNQPCQPVSTRNLNGIINHAIDDLTVTVSAGMPLAELQASLAKSNQWLPVDWPWGSQPDFEPIKCGSIGGLIARGLSGSLRQRYMGTRDQIIGIGLLRSDGVLAHAGGKVVKNVAGYDLMRLLNGSWGSLALITELTLRTQPIKSWHTRLDIEGPLKSLEGFRAALLKTSFTPEYCDWVGTTPNKCLLEIGLASVSNEAITSQLQGMQKLAEQHNCRANSHEWNGPFIEQKYPNHSLESNFWLIRIALPPAKTHQLLASNELQKMPNFEYRIAAGLGTGDIWQIASFKTIINFKKPIQDMRDKVHLLGGNLTLLNQPSLTNDRLPSWLDSKSKALIKSVKYQFDPHHQLAPGRLPGVCDSSKIV